VHCDELIQALAKRAEAICNKLLARMSQDHLDANKACVCGFFRIKYVEFTQLATGTNTTHRKLPETTRTLIRVHTSTKEHEICFSLQC